MKKWTTTLVVKRFEECVSTLRKLPNTHTLKIINYWPDIIYSERELARQTPTPIKLWATPDQITLMDLILHKNCLTGPGTEGVGICESR